MTVDEDLGVTYCTPEEVADTLDLPDPNDVFGAFSFSDVSHPSVNQVARMIRSNEDVIDRRLRRSWRENQVKDHVETIRTYWHDLNGWRSDYYSEGGDYIQLKKDMRPWDPTKGDRLEVRTRLNQWTDITYSPIGGENPDDDNTSWNVWFDYPMGKLYIKTRFFQQRYNALRITYRYGSEEEPPAAITRLCCLLTASQVLNMQFFNIKVGAGGDINGVKDATLRAWQDEINSIYTSYQRSGSVHSMLR